MEEVVEKEVEEVVKEQKPDLSGPPKLAKFIVLRRRTSLYYIRILVTFVLSQS